MNRAIAIRYGVLSDTEESPIINGSERSSYHRRYSAVGDPSLHPFGSHQILVSCLSKFNFASANFLSKDLPGTVIHFILKYLDPTSLNSAKTFIKSKSGQSLAWDIDHYGSEDSGVPKRFGSKARLAMMELSKRLRPLTGDNKRSHPFMNDNAQQSGAPTPSYGTENKVLCAPANREIHPLSSDNNSAITEIVDAFRKCNFFISLGAFAAAAFLLVLFLNALR
jgi:hypothetical protein